jgi:hypothetical protein
LTNADEKQLAIGQGTTIMLLVLVLVMLVPRSPSSSRPQEDSEEDKSKVAMGSVGLLQILWFFRAQEKVAEVDDPTMDNLRKAGMINIKLAGLRSRKEGKTEGDPLV